MTKPVFLSISYYFPGGFNPEGIVDTVYGPMPASKCYELLQLWMIQIENNGGEVIAHACHSGGMI